MVIKLQVSPKPCDRTRSSGRPVALRRWRITLGQEAPLDVIRPAPDIDLAAGGGTPASLFLAEPR